MSNFFDQDLAAGFEIKDKDPNYIMDRDAYIEAMLAQGYAVVDPAPNELFIDMDTDEHYETFQAQLEMLNRNNVAACVTRLTPSRNGLPGRHAVVAMPFDMTTVERIAWQAALGSDPMRELLSMVRHTNGDKRPTIFVEAS